MGNKAKPGKRRKKFNPKPKHGNPDLRTRQEILKRSGNVDDDRNAIGERNRSPEGNDTECGDRSSLALLQGSQCYHEDSDMELSDSSMHIPSPQYPHRYSRSMRMYSRKMDPSTKNSFHNHYCSATKSTVEQNAKETSQTSSSFIALPPQPVRRGDSSTNSEAINQDPSVTTRSDAEPAKNFVRNINRVPNLQDPLEENPSATSLHIGTTTDRMDFSSTEHSKQHNLDESESIAATTHVDQEVCAEITGVPSAEKTSEYSPKTSAKIQAINKEQQEIDAHQLAIEKFRPLGVIRNMESLKHRRIVDISHFIKEVAKLGDHECLKNRQLGGMDFLKEQRLGLASVLTFRCNYCGQARRIKTIPEGSKQINMSSVAGSYAIGKGHDHLAELLVFLGIPPLSYDAFRNYEDEVAEVFFDALEKDMIEAGKAERDISIRKGRFLEGMPVITVIADGGWSHRSYGHKYNAKSGVAVVIGKETKRLLYIGVRNKYCSVCAIAKRKNEKCPEHKCYLNWNGTSPAMEADIIVEGFNRSEEMHGVHYDTLIADGDSSLLTAIRERVPYGRMVTKLDCVNHLLKNVKKNLFELQKKSSKEESKFLTNKKIKQISRYVRRLINEFTKDVDRRDEIVSIISNLGNHYLNDHRKCLSHVCSQSGQFKLMANLDFEFQNEVAKIIEDVTAHANSIVENETTNLAEGFMHLVSKFTGAKHVFYGRRGSYYGRCGGAGLLFNHGQNWRTKIWKPLHDETPKSLVKKFDAQRSRKNILHAKRRLELQQARHSSNLNEVLDDEEELALPLHTDSATVTRPKGFDYGKNCNREDASEEVIEQKKKLRLDLLKLNEEQRKWLEANTRKQSKCKLWRRSRTYRLTASHFGQICKRKKNKGDLVRTLLRYSDFQSKAMKWGSDHEEVAVAEFEKKTGKKVEKCGLYVHEDKGYLAASPDGRVTGENSLVEVKCPYSAINTNLDELAKSNKSFYLRHENGKLTLKKTDNYYYQIQGQLAITKAKKCYFVVWCKNQLHIEEIEFDAEFWKVMEAQLDSFYLEEMILEIVDSRTQRNMPVRNSKFDNVTEEPEDIPNTKEPPPTPFKKAPPKPARERAENPKTVQQRERKSQPEGVKEGHLKNGHLLSPVNIDGISWQLMNTCPFDCLATVIASAVKDNASYRQYMQIEGGHNAFAKFCCMMAEGAREDILWSERAKIILAEQLGTPGVPAEDDAPIALDCFNNINHFCNLLKSAPTLEMIGSCCNFDCLSPYYSSKSFLQPALHTLPRINLVEEVMTQFLDIATEQCDQCKAWEAVATPNIGHHIILSVDGLQDGSMSCVPQVTGCDTSFQIDTLQTEILVQERRFSLSGVIRFKNTHYVAYVRKMNGHWEIHDDLKDEPQLNPSTSEHINPHLLIYTEIWSELES